MKSFAFVFDCRYVILQIITLTLTSAFNNFDFSFSNEVTFTSAFDAKKTPGLELPSLHFTGYEPKQVTLGALILGLSFISKLSAATTR
jgi:hypothetical protein